MYDSHKSHRKVRMPLKVRTNFSNVIDDIEPNLRYLVTEEFTYMKLIKKIQRYH